MEVFGTAMTVVGLAQQIRCAHLDVKGFPDRCKTLSRRIDSLLPAVQLLEKSDASIIQEKDVEIKTYEKALTELLQCVQGIERLIKDLTNQTYFQKFFRQEKIKGQLDDFSERLDVLQNTLQFCVMVEMRVLFDKTAVEKKAKRDDFQKRSKEAFKNRQEVDLEDQQNDGKRLVEYLQDLKDLKEGQTMLQKQTERLSEQLEELKICVTKSATNPVGFDVEQVKTIKKSELTNWTELGEGSIGVVYKVMYGKETVAVKKIQPDKKANLTELGLNLVNEATILKKFDSTNVVRLWGIVNEPGDDTMIVYEYMSRGNLRSLLQEYKDRPPSDFSWERRIQMASGGALGLYRIHHQNPLMLLGDIGSDKFLVSSDYKLKICDVGFAKTKTSAGRTKIRKKIRELGTTYFAPEHLCSNTQRYDEWSEMYGYGLVMWEIATCEIPFKDKRAIEQTEFLEAKKMEPVPTDCPKGFAKIIDKCRSFDRVLRPLSGELVDQLEKCSRELESA